MEIEDADRTNSTLNDESRYAIQGFVPRHESIAKKLSDSGDKLGLDSFFSERIPFDSVTSKNVASKIVDTIVFLSQKSDKDIFHVYEFGAGLGVLAANVLDLMQAHHPDTYSRLKLHISDVSACKLNEIKRLSALRKHDSKLVYQICDLIAPKFMPSEEPLLVYHSYLFAALPVRHVIVNQGVIYEVLVKTSIHPDLFILDTDSGYPKKLNAADVKKYCERDISDISPVFSRRLSPFIQEQYDIIPLEDSSMSPEEIQVLHEWVAYAKPKEMHFLNFHYLAIKGTIELMKTLPIDAGYLSIDIGEKDVVQETQCIDLLSKYGPYTYYPFSYSAISYCAHKLGIDCQVQSQFAFSKSNIACFLSNTNNSDQYRYHFDKTYRDSQPNYYDEMREQFKKIKTGREFTKFWSSWPQLQRSYLFWLGLARTMIGKKLYEPAIESIYRAIEESNGLSSTARILLAEVYQIVGMEENALDEYVKLSENSEIVDDIVFAKLIIHYQDTEQFDKIVHLTKKWINSTRRNVIDEQVDMLINAMNQSSQDHSVMVE